MSLHNGIDTVSIITHGVWSKTYGAANGGNIASLHASFGMLETAPGAAGGRRSGAAAWLLYYLLRRS